MGRYLIDYWREAPGRAWRDAWAFMRKHVIWEVAIFVAALVILFVVRLHRVNGALAVLDPSDLGHEIVLGLLLMGSAAFLIWLWHLFIVTPARIRRDLIQRADDSERIKQETISQYISTQPKLDVSFEWANFQALLVIHNVGAAAEYFDARLQFSGGLPVPPRGNLFCQGGRREPLPKSGTARLLLAEFRVQARSPSWRFYYSNDGKNDSVSVASSFVTSACLEVDVSCHPENQYGVIHKRIICGSGECREQPVTPPSLPSPDPPHSTASEQSPPPSPESSE